MANKTGLLSSSRVEIEPPGLELDLGYSILEARPSVKLKLSLGVFSRKQKADRFTIPLRKWWVAFKGRRDGRQDITGNDTSFSAFEEEILRERHQKITDIEEVAELDLAAARRNIEENIPDDFASAQVVERLSNQTSNWFALFREALIQARENFERSKATHVEAEQALADFVKLNNLHAKKPPARLGNWERASSLIGLVFLEALISVPLFAERHHGQLVLSFLIPVTTSLANAIAGLLVGAIGVYNIIFGHKYAKILASVGVGLTFLFVAWMDLAVARWRETENGLTDGLIPQTALSIVLLVISVGVFAYAVFKGFQDFSPGFPGHDEKWDEHRQARYEFTVWKDRYLFLVHAMRVTSKENLDSVRLQIASVRQLHIKRRTLAQQIIIDLQAMERLLPGLYKRIDTSTMILLKTYRESATRARKLQNASVDKLNYDSFNWIVPMPDIAKAKQRVEALLAIVERNLTELNRFEERFEREVAASAIAQIQAVADEAKSETAQQEKDK